MPGRDRGPGRTAGKVPGSCWYPSEVQRSGHPWPTVGWLLRSWRTSVARRTASSVAAAVGVTRAALANWEADQRRPSSGDLAALDAAMGAGGSLLGLCNATGTPSALGVDRTWWHQFSAGSGPCWAWVRTGEAPARIRVHARWATLEIDVERDCGAEGVILTLPVSTAETPLCVTIDEPGWVDFGNGVIPGSFQIPSSSVVPAIRRVSPGEPVVALFAAGVKAVLKRRGDWVERVDETVGLSTAWRTEAQRGDQAADLRSQEPCTGPPPLSQWPGVRYRRLREARVQSRREASLAVSALWPEQPLTEGQLETFEGGGRPRIEHLAERLDLVYRAGGRTFVSATRVDPTSSGWQLRLPDWWLGPVWVQPFREEPSAAEQAKIGIQWGPWQKWIRTRSHAVFSTHKMRLGPSAPRVLLPEGWALAGGIGAHPAAAPIDFGWWPISERHANQIFKHQVPHYLDLFGRSMSDIHALFSANNSRDAP